MLPSLLKFLIENVLNYRCRICLLLERLPMMLFISLLTAAQNLGKPQQKTTVKFFQKHIYQHLFSFFFLLLSLYKLYCNCDMFSRFWKMQFLGFKRILQKITHWETIQLCRLTIALHLPKPR